MVSAPTIEPWTWNLRMQNLNCLAYWFVSFFVFVDLFSSIFISLKLHSLVLMAYLSAPADTQIGNCSQRAASHWIICQVYYNIRRLITAAVNCEMFQPLRTYSFYNMSPFLDSFHSNIIYLYILTNACGNWKPARLLLNVRDVVETFITEVASP